MELGQDEMYVEGDDIARWIREERWDILNYLNFCSNLSPEIKTCFDMVDLLEWQCEDCFGGEIINPHVYSTRCVFLRKVRNKPHYKCGIQETKPNHCRVWKVGEWKNCVTLKGEQQK